MNRTHTHGKAQLLEWLQRSALRRADLAARLDVSATVVSLWCTGLRRPNRKNAAALEKLAGIQASCWAQLAPAEEAAA